MRERAARRTSLSDPLLALVAGGVFLAGSAGIYSREGVGVFFFLLALPAFGFAVGRWWAVALAFAPAPLSLLDDIQSTDPPGWELWLALGIPFAALIGLGMVARHLVGLRSAGPRAE